MQNKMVPYPVMILPGLSVVPLNFNSCNGSETPLCKLEVGMFLIKLGKKRCPRTDTLPKWTLSCEALKTSGPDFSPNIRNQQHNFVTQDQGWPLMNNNLSAIRSDSRQLLQVSHRLKVAASLSPYWIAPTGVFIFPPVSNRALHCQFLKQQEGAPVNSLKFVGREKKKKKQQTWTNLLLKLSWQVNGMVGELLV